MHYPVFSEDDPAITELTELSELEKEPAPRHEAFLEGATK
jgi:hypothetical protein